MDYKGEPQHGQAPPPYSGYPPPQGQPQYGQQQAYAQQPGMVYGQPPVGAVPPPTNVYYPPTGGYVGATGQNTIVITQQGGNCPNCRVGILVDEFSTAGLLLAILFFPIGLICCFAMQEKRCTHCGARF